MNFMYVYMPTGERLKKVDFLAVTEEVFMYDGDDVTADYTRAIGSSTFPNADRTYVNTPGSIDSKIARIEAGSPEVVRYYVGDAIGSVHQMIAANGTKIRESLYTAWGEDLPGFTGTGFSDRHAFTQRERDEETADASGTALMHFRARSYDPRTGRFIQNDPFLKERIRQHFIYAANRPVDLKDPRGTQTVQDIEQEVTNHFYFRRAFQPLKDDGWRIRRKGFWVHNSDYDLSTRTIWIDDDEVSAAEAATWVLDAVRRLYASNDVWVSRRRFLIRDFARERYALNPGASTALDAYASTADFAAWFHIDVGSVNRLNDDEESAVEDIALVLASTTDWGRENGTWYVGDAHLGPPTLWDTGFQRRYRDGGNQVRHSAGSMIGGFQQQVLAQYFLAGREVWQWTTGNPGATVADVLLGAVSADIGAGLDGIGTSLPELEDKIRGLEDASQRAQFVP